MSRCANRTHSYWNPYASSSLAAYMLRGKSRCHVLSVPRMCTEDFGRIWGNKLKQTQSDSIVARYHFRMCPTSLASVPGVLLSLSHIIAVLPLPACLGNKQRGFDA